MKTKYFLLTGITILIFVFMLHNSNDVDSLTERAVFKKTDLPSLSQTDPEPMNDLDADSEISKSADIFLNAQLASKDKVIINNRTKTDEATLESAIVQDKWIELPDLRAIASNEFHESFGTRYLEQSGYTIYKTQILSSGLTNFDGKTKLVVKSKTGSSLAVVNGDIQVVFNKYPNELNFLVHEFNLKIIYEARHLNLVIFSPQDRPVNLMYLIEQIKKLPEVKKADLSLVFGSRKPV
ncbi:MAG: hypothetical protein A2Z20_04695 [Bdellovibrionales bacterium RBG_16_40_8]|nr:MAG: hypothetical protein A2Z20_04695 [Bdellovibrionales bacterium RBG_16_40_8]